MELEIDTPRWALPLLQPARYKGVWGGRASGKSHVMAENLVEAMVMDADLRAVCIREVQKSLKFSAKQLVEDKIKAMGVGHLFDVQAVEIKRKGGAGVCIFQGMQDHTADSIKSLEGFRIAWIEEAQALSDKSLRLLRPTMRAPGAEIWASWNPDQPDDAIDKFLRGQKPPEGAIVLRANWQDNPWLPDEIKAEIAHDWAGDPETYAHVWLGEYNTRSEAQIFAGRYKVDEFEPGDDWDGPYFGADWGFAQDPTILVKCWVMPDGRVAVEKESGKVGLDIDKTGDLWGQDIPEAQRATIRADSARPETISYMQRHGWKGITGVDKWKGSVEDGVEWLRTKGLLIHPRCQRAQREARLYRYKVNKAGDVLAQIEDAENHIWDAVRYALAPLIRARSQPETKTTTVVGMY
ncbi:PBSX family phage terminase large subunit [Paracoccus sp. SY]|uniref:PBSX family phage terminase large subunit n=1 Tax=Paracoccus sp. SY TaxID=1330255 RepID=UPI000CD1CF80|nr:PBSX family phage terminase large subunit [Paracoccus sp. SY]